MVVLRGYQQTDVNMVDETRFKALRMRQFHRHLSVYNPLSRGCSSLYQLLGILYRSP